MIGNRLHLSYFLCFLLFIVILAGKREGQLSPSLLSKTSSLLISTTSSSTIFSFPSSHTTTVKESNLSSSISSHLPTKSVQQTNQIIPTKSTINDDKPMLRQQPDANISDITSQSPTQQRRLPLPNKLTFEQNIANLIEQESPLLQSELLTAEHELSVLRSRLAVHEGVTAVTGTILKSLKGQFEPQSKVDTATSPLDIYKQGLFLQSSAIQTSPMLEISPEIPESVEIHYDAQTSKSPYLVVKTKNSFWIAQPIPVSEAQTHLKGFSSPVMKRATVKLPDKFDQTFSADSDNDDEQIIERDHQTVTSELDQYPSPEGLQLTKENVQSLSKESSQNLETKANNWATEILASSTHNESVSSANERSDHQNLTTEIDENVSLSKTELSTNFQDAQGYHQISREIERSVSDVKEHVAEMKTVHSSSSFLTSEHQLEQFNNKINEIYSIIDYFKNSKSMSTNFNIIHAKIDDLKVIMSRIELNKQDELRIEYELDELEDLLRGINDNLINQTHQHKDYNLIDLFEQNVNELRRIVNDIKSSQFDSYLSTTVKSDEQAATTAKTTEDIAQQNLTNVTEQLIPKETDWTTEQMAEYFQRGPDGQLLLSSKHSCLHLISEEPVVAREISFEGDKSVGEKKSSRLSVTHLIPQHTPISVDSFYEDNRDHSLCHSEHAKETTTDKCSPRPESTVISSHVSYEDDLQRSMFVEHRTLSESEPVQLSSPPASIDNLRKIMNELMFPASWSKVPTKIEKHQIWQNEEVLAESFITAEESHPTPSLCEIVHEIENISLSSAEKLDHSENQTEERDTISPFDTRTPIFVHRAIITRQDTELWPQNETIIVSDKTNKDVLTTGELEKMAADVRQYENDSMISTNRTKEIYEVQGRSDIELSDEMQQTNIDDTLPVESTLLTDELKDQISFEPPQDQIEAEHETEHDQVERILHTENIVECQSTVRTERECYPAHEIQPIIPAELEQNLHTQGSGHHSFRLNEHEEDQEDKGEDDTSVAKEYEVETKEKEQYHQQLQFRQDQVASKKFQRERQEDQDKDSSTKAEMMIAHYEKLEPEIPATEYGYQPEQSVNLQEFTSISEQLIGDEVEQKNDGRFLNLQIPVIEKIWQLENRRSSEEASTESSNLSEHVEEQWDEEKEDQSKKKSEAEQYQSESTRSSDAMKVESTKTVDQDIYELLQDFEQQSIETPEEISKYKGKQAVEAEQAPSEAPDVDDHEIRRKSNVVGMDIQLSCPDEDNLEEERYEHEQERSTDQITVKSAKKLDENQSKIEEEKPQVKPVHEYEGELSAELIADDTLALNEDELERQRDQHADVTIQTVEKLDGEPFLSEDDRESQLTLKEDTVIAQYPETLDKAEKDDLTYEKHLNTEAVTSETLSVAEIHDSKQYYDECTPEKLPNIDEKLFKSSSLNEHNEVDYHQSVVVVEALQRIAEGRIESKEECELVPNLNNAKRIVVSAPSSDEEEEEEEEERYEYKQEGSIKSSQQVHEETNGKSMQMLKQNLYDQQYQCEQDKQDESEHEFMYESDFETQENKLAQELSASKILVEAFNEDTFEERTEDDQPGYEIIIEESHQIEEDEIDKQEAKRQFHEDQYEMNSSFERGSMGFYQQIKEESSKSYEQYKFEQTFGTDEIIVDSSHAVDYEEPDKERQEIICATVLFHDDEQSQPERTLNTHQIANETSRETKVQKYVPPLTSEQVTLPFSEEIEEKRSNTEMDLQHERKLSAEKNLNVSSQSSLNEDDQRRDEFILEGQQAFEEDEQYLYQSNPKRTSTDQIIVDVSATLKNKEEELQYERPFQSESATEEPHKEILKCEHKNQWEDIEQINRDSQNENEHEEGQEQEFHYDEVRRLSDAEHIITESSDSSEKDARDQSQSEEKQITDVESLEIIEQKEEQNIQYERPLSSEHISITFPEEKIEEALQKLHSYDESEPSVCIEKNTVACHEENEQDEILRKLPSRLYHSYESILSSDGSPILKASQNFERQIDDENFTDLQSLCREEDDDDGKNGVDSNEVEDGQINRPQPWTQSPFQRDEIYGNKYRPGIHSTESSEIENHLSPNRLKRFELESPITSHIQHSNIISHLIPTYLAEKNLEKQEDEDDDVDGKSRPTHLDILTANKFDQSLSAISTPDSEIILSSLSKEISDRSNQYEQILAPTSDKIVDQILHDSIIETIERDKNYLLYQTARDIVNDVIDNIYLKYDDEIIRSQIEEATSADVSINDLTDWSLLVEKTSDVSSEGKSVRKTTNENYDGEENDRNKFREKVKDEYSTLDDEEKEKHILQITDQTHLSAPDAATSESIQELSDFVEELPILEQPINIDGDMTRSPASSSSLSPSSSASGNDEIYHYDLNKSQITTTTSANELRDIASELQTIEQQFESKLDSVLEQKIDSSIPAKLRNELEELEKECKDNTEHLHDRLKRDEILQSTDIDALSRDISNYRRASQSEAPDNYAHRMERQPSSPPTSPLYRQQFVQVTCSSMSDVDQVQDKLLQEQEENEVLGDMIDIIIREALKKLQTEVNIIRY